MGTAAWAQEHLYYNTAVPRKTSCVAGMVCAFYAVPDEFVFDARFILKPLPLGPFQRLEHF